MDIALRGHHDLDDSATGEAGCIGEPGEDAVLDSTS